jgi:hypothetical protein
MALHAVLVVAVVIVPTLLYEAMPEPGAAVRAFFSTPLEIAPPPPPPPPPAPAAAAHVVRQAPVAPRALDPAAFIAPIEVPDQIKLEEGLDPGSGAACGGVGAACWGLWEAGPSEGRSAARCVTAREGSLRIGGKLTR